MIVGILPPPDPFAPVREALVRGKISPRPPEAVPRDNNTGLPAAGFAPTLDVIRPPWGDPHDRIADVVVRVVRPAALGALTGAAGRLE